MCGRQKSCQLRDDDKQILISLWYFWHFHNYAPYLCPLGLQYWNLVVLLIIIINNYYFNMFFLMIESICECCESSLAIISLWTRCRLSYCTWYFHVAVDMLFIYCTSHSLGNKLYKTYNVSAGTRQPACNWFFFKGAEKWSPFENAKNSLDVHIGHELFMWSHLWGLSDRSYQDFRVFWL